MIIGGIIDRLEEDYAVILLDSGNRVDWPILALPDEIGEGDSVNFSINENVVATNSREELARTMLNQLLG